jgi:chemotaxis methyl-accepting protein methylase/signal transduction histidine kinase/chemotaxis response regulator CheB
MLDVPQPLAHATFPVVAIGASAGGLEAFTQLLRRMPSDTGLAFVLIQHLDRTHPSHLSEALQNATTMPVRQAEHDMRVVPNHVYVIAPNTDLAMKNGALVATPRPTDGSGSHLPVDFFMQSLATELGGHAMGVILSGSASDGTEGLRAIKAQDGITLAQSPTSARFPSMPQSANDAGVVDYCLDIPELADELVRLSRHPYVREGPPEAHTADDALRDEIFAIVRAAIGLDFSEFKSATVQRRLARRLALRGAADLKAYLALLRAEPEEIRALYEDMLIHVTSFFRDPEVFTALRDTVFPEILKNKAPGAAVRIWAAGCSTGEEAYSLAIALLELTNASPNSHPIQIFGSDVSEVAIRKARAGFYGEGALRNVGEEQLRRYFTKVEGGYRIDTSVRERCVFVRHDFARDPPFSKLDLVCCRNVLIYFDQALQKKVVPLLHYALNQPGYLVLGRSEHISAFTQLFSIADKDNKIFSRTSGASGQRFAPRTSLDPLIAHLPAQQHVPASGLDARFARHLDQLLLSRYSPPGVLINSDLDVLLFRGSTGAFLQAAAGPPQQNLINMARGGLIAALRSTIEQAKQDMVVVRQRNVEVSEDGVSSRCDVVVIPFSGIPGNDQSLFIVLFERPGSAPIEEETIAHVPVLEPSTSDDRRSARLAHELAATKEYLHTLLEEHNRASDELGASNEELISGNEELQSMNEELETAKEELQSINEELTTLNDELRIRNQEVEHLIGEAQSARAEAEAARTEAERANRAKDDFLATLSHELRTPLSIMLLQSQRLRDGGLADPESLKRAGESLERATWTQVNLIDDLLDVSRIITGKLTIDLRRVDLGGAVRMALDAMSPLLEAKALALTLSIEPHIEPIWADAARAQQIVTNLLNNAIKFTPAGGHVTVTVDSLDGFGQVRVTDTGIGIAPSFLPHVFARFSQSDTSITRKYGGLGLGLALVRHLVEVQGGTVSAESAGVDEGASFLVRFPFAAIKTEGEVTAVRPRPTQVLDRPGKTRQYDALMELRVLFVDDDQATREAVREVLQYTGAQVEVAACAADGATAVATFKPHVILCDIAMPEEDGYTFMRKLRAREKALGPSHANIPALALTALATDEDKQRATAAGFQLHLAKPIDIDRLRDSVLALSKLVTPPHGRHDVV